VLGGPVVGHAPGDQVPTMRVPDELATTDPDAGVADQETPGWAEKLVRLLDDGLKVPGTDFGVGIDPLIGLIPGVGDLVTGSGSLALIYLGFKERIPTVALARMVLNIAIDTLGGGLPVIGDVFDVLWKSNRKNLDIIEKYRADPDAKPTALDYLLVFVSVLLVLTSVLLPVAIVWLLAGMGIFAVDQLLSGG
jgi:hypothetical protein